MVFVAELQKHALSNPIADRYIQGRTPARAFAVKIAIKFPCAKSAVQAPAIPRKRQIQVQAFENALFIADAPLAPLLPQREVIVQAAVETVALRIQANTQARVLALKIIIEKQRRASDPVLRSIRAIHHAKIGVGAQLFRLTLPESQARLEEQDAFRAVGALHFPHRYDRVEIASQTVPELPRQARVQTELLIKQSQSALA